MIVKPREKKTVLPKEAPFLKSLDDLAGSIRGVAELKI
jgi:hypothetical protein